MPEPIAIDDRKGATADGTSSTLDTGRFIKYLFIIAVTMSVLGVALNIYLKTPSELPKPSIVGVAMILMYANAEANLFAWFSILTLAAMGVAFATAALIKRDDKRQFRAYLVIAIVAFALSADEGATLHERLGNVASRISVASSFTYAWIVLAIPVVIAVGLLLLWVARAIDRKLRNRLILAGVVFLAGAAGVETLGAMLIKLDHGLSDYTTFVLHDVTVFFEEGMEITGAILGLRAILSHLRIERSHAGITVTTLD